MEDGESAIGHDQVLGSTAPADKCRDLIPTLRVMVPAISRILSRAPEEYESKLEFMQGDIDEIYKVTTESLDSTDRLIKLKERIDSHLDLGLKIVPNTKYGKPAVIEQLELPCLRFLSKYDTYNGTTYALLWTGLLNSITYQLLAATKGSEHAKTTCRWQLFEKIGSTLFAARNPKHFAGGVSPCSLEILLSTARGISMLVTPVAIVLAEHDCFPSSPYYLHALDQLRQLIADEIRPLHTNPQHPQALAVHNDFTYWLTNSKLRGRGGHILDTPIRQSSIPTNTADSVECSLAVFDSFCHTEFLSLYRNSFLKLEEFVKELSAN